MKDAKRFHQNTNVFVTRHLDYPPTHPYPKLFPYLVPSLLRLMQRNYRSVPLIAMANHTADALPSPS